MNSNEIEELDGLNKSLYADFIKLMNTLSPTEVIELSRPFLLHPGMTINLKRHTRLKELANNGWLQVYKPETLIDLRLEFLTNTLEGIVKHVHKIIEYAIRKQEIDSLNCSNTFGGSVNYVQSKVALGKIQTIYPELNNILLKFGKFQDLRNAVSHDQYMILPHYDDQTNEQILAAATNLTELQNDIKSLLLNLGEESRNEMFKIPEIIGKQMGLKPDSGPNQILNKDKSFIIYEVGSSWKPLSKSSPKFTVGELTILLNKFDQFFFTTTFAIMADIGFKTTNGKIIERKCRFCKAPTFTEITTSTFDCWHCLAAN